MKTLWWFLAFSLAYLAQGTILNTVSFLGVTPNLILCLTVLVCFCTRNRKLGPALGLIFGLALDFTYGTYLGISALLLFALGLIIMRSIDVINKESPFSILIITVMGTLGYNILYWIIMSIMGSKFPFIYMLELQFAHVLYNCLLVGIVRYFITIKTSKRRRNLYFQ